MVEQKMRYDVVVVGYGLLGNAAALLLAQQGLSVAVVERKKSDDLLLSKSARLDEEVLLILEQLELMPYLKEQLHPLESTQIIDKKERVLFQLRQTPRSDFAPWVGFYQPDIQRILQQRASASPLITLLSEHQVETMEEHEKRVNVYIRPVKKQTFRALEARFVVVCNGQESRVKELLQLEEVDYKYRSSILCVDTLRVAEQVDATTHAHAQTIYDAAFPVTRITNNDRYQRWEFQIEQAYLQAEQTPQKIRSLLEELGMGEATVSAAFIYHFDTKILREWRKGRILIAGDAAHVIPPYLGMSLSEGIKDVHNIAWKLRAILRQKASLTLLDSYQQERQPHIQRLIRLNMWVKRLFQSSRLRWIKNLVPVLPKAILQKKLEAGSQIYQGIISTGKATSLGRITLSPKVTTQKGKIKSLNCVLNNNFVVLALEANPVDALRPNQIAYAAALGVQFIQISPQQQTFHLDRRYAQQIHDRTGALQVWLKKQRAHYLVLRPDRVVYACCKNKKQLNVAIQELSQQFPLCFH
ncbi:MAG: FAD-dependent monooxygenase [Aureispira sp.]